MKCAVESRVCAIILTYKNRGQFVNEVIHELIEQGVLHIILVSNGAPLEQFDYAGKFNNINLISLKKNMGSGEGFRIGITEALKTRCDFLWLLDDDNLPKPNCLLQLLSAWGKKSEFISSNKLALSCYREDQYENREIEVKNNVVSVQPRNNSYYGFHIVRLILLIYKRIFKNRKQSNYESIVKQGHLYNMDGAFFGGLFIHRDIIESINLPNKEYFVYADDLEYTHRVIKNGGQIFMVCNAQIKSLDWSIPFNIKARWLYHSTLDYLEPFRTYYCARNLEHHTRKNFVTNKPLYYFNLATFIITISTVAVIRGKITHLKLLIMGITHSWQGKLGEKPNLH